MSELKRCPFCGGSPRTEMMVSKMGGGEDFVDFTIRCINCRTSKMSRLTILGYASFIDAQKAMEMASEQWNQRAETAAS